MPTLAPGRWTVEGLCPANISDKTVVSTTAGEWRRAIGDILRFSQQSDGAVTAVSWVWDQEKPEGVMVRHHFRLRDPSTMSLTPTAAFRQLVRSSLAEDTEPPPQDTLTYMTPPTMPVNEKPAEARQKESGKFCREYVALVCPVTARPEGNGAVRGKGTMISPEQETPEQEAPEQAESSVESTTSDLSETEPEEEATELRESDLREPTGWLCWSRGGPRE